MEVSKSLGIAPDDWSQLARHRKMPEIDGTRMSRYRLARVRAQLKNVGASMGIFVNPVSLRYAVDYRGYALFQSHIPSTYLFVPVEGPVAVHGFLANHRHWWI
jgi:hypothetical protein